MPFGMYVIFWCVIFILGDVFWPLWSGVVISHFYGCRHLDTFCFVFLAPFLLIVGFVFNLSAGSGYFLTFGYGVGYSRTPRDGFGVFCLDADVVSPFAAVTSQLLC